MKKESFVKINEGNSIILGPKENKVSKKLPVFYNPVMKLNRDISIFLVNSIKNKNMQIALPLTGTGIRGIRFLLELEKEKIKSISFNDYNKKAIKVIKKNLKLNKINLKSKKIIISNNDANLFIIGSTGFDYIDIDPFGTPNPFLDSAVKRISREGIIAVTATDTSALAGTYKKACIRKYWAIPLRNELKHEIGIRILIRKVQLIGAQFEKALTPIYSYADQHYMRIFFKCEKRKSKVDLILKKHDYFNEAGPIWTGGLWDKKLASSIAKKSDEKITKIIANEAKINTIGFHDIHKLCKRNKIKEIPKTNEIIKILKKKNYKCSLTHFSPTGIKSNINEKEFIKIIKNISIQ